jgi:hypothetical protein
MHMTTLFGKFFVVPSKKPRYNTETCLLLYHNLAYFSPIVTPIISTVVFLPVIIVQNAWSSSCHVRTYTASLVMQYKVTIITFIQNWDYFCAGGLGWRHVIITYNYLISVLSPSST